MSVKPFKQKYFFQFSHVVKVPQAYDILKTTQLYELLESWLQETDWDSR